MIIVLRQNSSYVQFLEKYDTSGNLLYSKQLPSDIYPYDGIKLDSQGNVFSIASKNSGGDWQQGLAKFSGSDFSTEWSVVELYGGYSVMDPHFDIDEHGDAYLTSNYGFITKYNSQTGSQSWRMPVYEPPVYPEWEESDYPHDHFANNEYRVVCDKHGGVWASRGIPHLTGCDFECSPDWLRRFSLSGSRNWVSAEALYYLVVYGLYVDFHGNVTPRWNDTSFRKYNSSGTIIFSTINMPTGSSLIRFDGSDHVYTNALRKLSPLGDELWQYNDGPSGAASHVVVTPDGIVYYGFYNAIHRVEDVGGQPVGTLNFSVDGEIMGLAVLFDDSPEFFWTVHRGTREIEI